MSQQVSTRRTNIRDIKARKGVEPIVCLTAYTAPMARILDPHVDLMLVGDSVGTVLHGHITTVRVTLDAMLVHTRSVMRAQPQSVVVMDLPFGTYEASPQQAFDTASRVMKESAVDAVKLEGGELQAPTIEFLTKRGIAVMAHIGLQPQSVMAAGGYRVVGRNEGDDERLMRDARAVADAGAFAVVIEGTVEPLARKVTQEISIPTIGIGASAGCDGQILVTEDMLGFFEKTPKFVREYARLRDAISEAAEAFARDVRARDYPGPDEVYDVNPKKK